MTNEHGLSLPETMVTKEEALSKLNKIKINLYAIENGNGINLSHDERIEIMQGFAREIITDTETLEKFIEQQSCQSHQ